MGSSDGKPRFERHVEMGSTANAFDGLEPRGGGAGNGAVGGGVDSDGPPYGVGADKRSPKSRGRSREEAQAELLRTAKPGSSAAEKPAYGRMYSADV